MTVVEQCIQQLEKGQMTKAKRMIEEVSQHGEPGDQLQLADALNQLGFLEEAIQLYNVLLVSFPEEPELLLSAAEASIELDNEEDALTLLEKVPDSSDLFSQALLIQADLYERQGLFEVAERKLKRASQMNEEEPVLFFALGELYASLGRFAEATNAYEMAEMLGGDTTLPLSNRFAQSYAGAGKFEEALPYFEKALQKEVDPDLLFAYGVSAYQAGSKQTAISKLEELISMDPSYHGAYRQLAVAYESDEQLDKAIQTIEKGIAQDSFQKELYLQGGKLALKTTNEQLAEKWLREAIALDAQYGEAVQTLSSLLLSKERYEDVLELIALFEADGEEDSFLDWDAGKSLRELERYEDALNRYTRAYTVCKEYPSYLEEYGSFLLEEGKHLQAREVFQLLLQTDPTNAEWNDIVARL
ncbi:tetratricopeptide repeat protein [Bacillus fonticola]|uniref:tetratricopeptide repeat protein n=1 Tax=Bacillus fonticola TaxID=2728853 RepID=UPI001474EFB2|nr:tetratricopeptide repeat protein [Bacillus fonticola]